MIRISALVLPYLKPGIKYFIFIHIIICRAKWITIITNRISHQRYIFYLITYLSKSFIHIIITYYIRCMYLHLRICRFHKPYKLIPHNRLLYLVIYRIAKKCYAVDLHCLTGIICIVYELLIISTICLITC